MQSGETKLFTSHNNLTALKLPVCFVRQKSVTLMIGMDFYRGASDDLAPILDGCVVWKGQFPQTMKGKESGEQQGDEEEIVMDMGPCIVCENTGDIG